MKEVFDKLKKFFLNGKTYNPKLISAFIIVQPMIDILTFFMKEYLNLNLTIGILIRALFLVYAVIYMVFKDNKHRKSNYIYIISLGVFFVLHIIINYIFKDLYNFSNEIKNIIKISYFPLTLLFFIRYNQNSDNNSKLSTKILCINACLISIAMILSKITGTQLCSYGQTLNCSRGSSGWFYSANELSSLLIVLFAVVLYEFYKSKFSFGNIITMMLIIYGLAVIGTKASYLGFVVILVLSLVLHIVIAIFKRKEHNKQIVIMTLVIILMTFLLTPSMPVCYNNYKLFLNYNIYCKVPVDVSKEVIGGNTDNNSTENNDSDESDENKVEIDYDKIKEDVEKEYLNTVNNTVSNDEKNEIVLNGRDDYLRVNLKIFNQSSLLRKIFGIGYKNHKYENLIINHIVERDYHDLLFQYGYLGFVLILIPLLYLIISICLSIIRKPKKILDDKNLILIGITICLAGAFVSGHTLFAPAVTIYISYLLGYVFVKVKE